MLFTKSAFHTHWWLLLVVLVLPIRTLSAAEMVMVTPRSPDSAQGRWFTLIYTEAFSRLGWTFVYEQYPSKRCAVLSNNGIVDGEMERIETFHLAYPNLIRVEESLQTLKFVAYATDPSFVVDGWESLRGTDWRVNYRRGVKLFEEKLPTVLNPQALEDLNTPEQGFKKLLSDRTDIYVEIESVALPVLQDDEFVQSPIIRAGVLEQIATYPFLHKTHKKRAHPLAVVLKAMKEEGLFENYWKRVQE